MPMWIQADLKTYDLRSLGTLFDVIYIDPPWEEYAKRSVAMRDPTQRPFWTPEEIVRHFDESCLLEDRLLSHWRKLQKTLLFYFFGVAQVLD